MRQLSDETIREIDAVLEAAGFSKKRPVRIKKITVKGKWHFYEKLEKIAQRNGFNSRVSEMVVEAGWKSEYLTRQKEELVEALRKFYKFKDCERACRGETELPSVQEFKKRHRRIVWAREARCRRDKNLPPLDNIIDSLYPELDGMLPSYLKLYDIITRERSKKRVDVDAVAEQLRKKYFLGEDISCTGLKACCRDIYRAVEVITKNHKSFGYHGTMTDIISQMTGIGRHYFSVFNKDRAKKLGSLSEEMTKLLLALTKNADPNAEFQTEKFRKTFPLPLAGINNSKGVRVYFSKRGYFVPDILIFSKGLGIVEVKNSRLLPANRRDKILKQIGSSKDLFYRQNGGRVKISSRAVVMHGPESSVEKIADELSGTGIKTFCGNDFGESLERALKESEGKISFPCSTGQIMEIYRAISYSPQMILQSSQIEKLNYTIWLLESIINSAGTKKIVPQKPISVFGNNDMEAKNEYGSFLLFNIPMSDAMKTPTAARVQENIGAIRENMLFLDFEATGLSRVMSQVISAGLAYMEGSDLQIEVAFARNPWEERALLHYVNQRIHKFKFLATYNGKSYDIPLLRNRSISNIILAEPHKNHIDVYRSGIMPAPPSKYRPESKKLKEIDRICGYVRQDISGAEVPKIYSTYLFGEGEISPALEHCYLDMVSLAAAYVLATKVLGVNLEEKAEPCKPAVRKYKPPVKKGEQMSFMAEIK